MNRAQGYARRARRLYHIRFRFAGAAFVACRVHRSCPYDAPVQPANDTPGSIPSAFAAHARAPFFPPFDRLFTDITVKLTNAVQKTNNVV